MAMQAVYGLFAALALIYGGLRLQRWRNGTASTDGNEGFRPHVGFSRLDGMQSLSLLLENESSTHVWTEDIEIFLTELVANEQTADPPCREVLRIRQMTPPGDTLPISLAGVIYKAAGEPQREYSCTLSSVVRFRIGEEQFERNLEDYLIRMIGLTASGIRRKRKQDPHFPTHEPCPDVAGVGARMK